MNDLLELMLRNALAASVFAVLVYGLCGFVRSARVRHVLWLCVLVRLFLPPVWTVPLFDRPAPGEDAAELAPAPLPPPVEGPGSSPDLLAFTWLPELSPERESAPPEEPAVATAPGGELPSLPRWELLLGLALATGTAVILLRGWGRIRRLRRELVHAGEAPEAVVRRVEELAGRMGLGRVPEVRVVAGRLSPMVWCPGWSIRRAKLLLPRDLLGRLTPEQSDSILVHELAH
jgi:hypothetical protein